MSQKILKFLTVLGIFSVVNSFDSTCYHYSREIATKPYRKFNLAPENDCWHYCKFDDKCNLFSVPKKHKTRTCSLYKENELTVEFRPKYSSNIIYGSKNCLMLPEILNNTQETNIFQTSLEDGLIIYRKDPGLCLEADFDEGSASPKYGYSVYWSSNCRDAKKWELNCTGIHGGLGGCSKAIVKVRNYSEYCLTFQTREDTWTATMQTCQKGTDDDVNSLTEYRQGLMLSEIYAVGWNVTLITLNNVRVCATLPSDSLWNFRVNHTLDAFELLSEQDLLDTPCRNVSVLNGQVLQSDAVPMFLPGEEMTVQCNPGFGAKFDNGSYLKVYNVTCWMFPSLIDCSLLPIELNSENSKALPLSTVLLVKAFALSLRLLLF